jgi:hypothetical protein
MIFEAWREMAPGPEEHLVVIPAGQVFEALIVFHGLSKAMAECIDLLPAGTRLELVNEESGEAVRLTESMQEKDHWRWYVSHEELRYGPDNLHALDVRRFIPKGRYRLAADFPGYKPHRSEPFETQDSDEVRPLIVELTLGR